MNLIREKTKKIKYLKNIRKQCWAIIIATVLFSSYCLILKTTELKYPVFEHLSLFFEQFHIMLALKLLIIVINSIVICLFFLEIIRRKGHIFSLIVSAKYTHLLRCALKENSDGHKISIKTVRSFNRSANRAVIYVDKKNAILAIDIPLDVQAHILLENRCVILQRKMNQWMPEYTFSGFEEKSNVLWLNGSRR